MKKEKQENKEKMQTTIHKDSRKFRYGTNATILTVGIVVIVFVLNFLLVTLNGKISLTLDFSKNKLYELSDQTKETLKTLNGDIDVIYFVPEGTSKGYVDDILEKYQQKSGSIKLRYVDAEKNPAEANKYSTDGKSVSVGSVVFAKGDKFRTVAGSEMMTQSSDGSSVSVQVEQKFTNALIYLQTDKLPVAYLSEGHGEKSMSQATSLLQSDNYEIKSINLMAEDLAVGDSILYINAPDRDFDAQEVDKIDTYLDKGGNVQIYFDPTQSPNSLERLEGYLTNEWGITRENLFAAENTSSKLGQTMTSAFSFGEVQSGHDATDTIVQNGLRIGIPICNPLTLSDAAPGGVSYNPLVKLSSTAIALTAEQMEQGQSGGAQTGPFDIVVAATRQVQASDNSLITGKLIVSGTSTGLEDMLRYTGLANGDLVQNMAGWMLEAKELVSIRPKIIKNEQVIIPKAHSNAWFVVLVFVLPLAILITGLVIWRKRRYR